MSLLPILKEPNPGLRRHSAKVKIADLPKLQKLVRDMIDTMYAAAGIGLAAPQIGQNICLAIIGAEAVKLSALKQKTDLALVNPVITKKSWRREWLSEGCLSVPGRSGEVERYKKIAVKALDLTGKPLNFEAEGLFAEVIQHEIDHLNGVLFIDRARNVKKIEKK